MKFDCKKYLNGFTYFGVLFVVVLIGLALSGASVIWQFQVQRQKEQQLMFIGHQYTNAIASYYHAAPGGVKHYPKTIAELLRDPRYPNVKRHLRKPWLDPFTMKSDWVLIRTKQGGIAGVSSLASGTPIKQAGFGNETLDLLLGGKTSYQQWRFIYIAAIDENPHSDFTTDNNGDDAAQEGAKESASSNFDQDQSDQEEENGEEFLEDKSSGTAHLTDNPVVKK